jgi:Na+/H+ antiporter NhaC
LAWTLGFILKSLGTSQIIIHLLPQDTSPYILPGIIFLFSCFISFATGSSFSTMGIVYPIALPIVFGVCKYAGFSPEVSNQILYHSIACVLSGAVFGDHCSPISDTTILSSIATECNHLQHVRTQLPYAMIVGGVSLFMSLTLANMGIHWIFVYGLGMLVLYMVVRVFGRTYR